jgi:hypothetical protein
MPVVIALEHRSGKTGRGYAKVKENFSSASLERIFETHDSKEASTTADGWSGYKPPPKKVFALRAKIVEQRAKLRYVAR